MREKKLARKEKKYRVTFDKSSDKINHPHNNTSASTTDATKQTNYSPIYALGSVYIYFSIIHSDYRKYYEKVSKYFRINKPC